MYFEVRCVRVSVCWRGKGVDGERREWMGRGREGMEGETIHFGVSNRHVFL